MTINIAEIQTLSMLSPLPITYKCDILHEDLCVWQGNTLPSIAIMLMIIRAKRGAPSKEMISQTNTLLLQAQSLGLLKLANQQSYDDIKKRSFAQPVTDSLLIDDFSSELANDLFWKIDHIFYNKVYDMCSSYTTNEIFESLIPIN